MAEPVPEDMSLDDRIFRVALSHGAALRSCRLSEFWLRKFLEGVGIGLDSAHITGVTDVLIETLWNLHKSEEDDCIGNADFFEILTKIAVRRQQATKMAERKRCLESEKLAIRASAPDAVSEDDSLEQFIRRSVEPYVEASCGPAGDVSSVERSDWAPLTRQIVSHAVATLFDSLFLPLFVEFSRNNVVDLGRLELALLKLTGLNSFPEQTKRLIVDIFDEANLYDTRGMTTGHIAEELELDEFVEAILLFAVRSKADDNDLVTIQAKAWVFLEEACGILNIASPTDVFAESDFLAPRARLCLTYPDVVPISEFGCFLVAGVFFPDVCAEQDAVARRDHIDNASKLAGPSRQDQRRTVELALKLHTNRFGRKIAQSAADTFFITVDSVRAVYHSTRRCNRYRVEVPTAVKHSGFQPYCTTAMEDTHLVITTHQSKSVLVATSEPSSPSDRLLLERRVSVQALSDSLTATMEQRFRSLAKDPEVGLTEAEFAKWYEQVKAAPRSFSLAKLVRDYNPASPLSSLFRCYSAAKGQTVSITIGRDGWYNVARTPKLGERDLVMGMSFPNTVAATWLAFLASQSDVVPSAERFFELSFDKLGSSIAPTPPVTLPAVGNLVVAPYTRALRQRDVAKSSAIKENEASRIRFDYSHPEPLSHDHEEETPLSLAEKHGTISTSKEALRMNVRAISDSLKQDYFTQQMVRLL